MNEIVNWFITTVSGVDPVLRVFIAGLGMFFETSILVGLVVPGDTIVFIAATGVSNASQYWYLVLAVLVGSLAGESLGFFLGRTIGRRIRDSKLGKRLIGDTWSVAEAYLAKRGVLAVFVSRFLPVLHPVVPLVCGMSAMRYRVFIRWTALACVLWTMLYVTAGFLLAEQFEIFATTFKGAGWVFIGGVVIFIVATHFAKKRLSRKELGDK
ncbi:MAG: DedA family protein [Aurantimicrobium sp.]|nr:DedA family protein [Aurantimicrobium sp.]